jgi:hypothetical protein
MAEKHDSSGGYVGAAPTQNASATPGVHSARYREERKRSGNWAGTAELTSTYSSGTMSLTGGRDTVLFALTWSANVVGNAGTTITLRRDSDSSLIASWVMTNGATSGTNWSISNNSLTLTVLGTATSSLSAGTALTLTVPAQAVKSTDGFPNLTGFTVACTTAAYGGAAGSAATSAKAIQQVTGTTTSGNYWIKNVDGTNARQLYCDMSTDGGGWTRWYNMPGAWRNNMPSQTIADYNLASFNTDTSHYSAATHRKSRADSHSSGGRLDYLIEQTAGNIKYRFRGLMEGDPGAGNRNVSHISGVSSSHFDFGWFANSNNGYWQGYNNSTNSSCSSSTNVVHGVSGSNSWNSGYFAFWRGYHSDPGTSAGCGDHCGNTRKYWYVSPSLWYQENCFSSYYSVSDTTTSGTLRIYYREVGTLGSGSL